MSLPGGGDRGDKLSTHNNAQAFVFFPVEHPLEMTTDFQGARKGAFFWIVDGLFMLKRLSIKRY